MKYTIDHFIKKFSKIPKERWCVGEYNKNGRHCALGHCGLDKYGCLTAEGHDLNNLFMHTFSQYAYEINDKRNGNFQQKSAKDRILAALKEANKILKNG